jgi:hypothetical protein
MSKTKQTENKGNDVSLPQSKRHQHVVGTVQEQAVEALFMMLVWVYDDTLVSSPRTASHGLTTGSVVNLCSAGVLVVVIWMHVTPPSGTGAVTASDGPQV